MFKKAERKQAKLRLVLSGTSGSGKTFGALQIAKGIGGKIAFLDTERGSASLYSDMVEFDVLEMQPPYNPERFIEVIQEAEKEEYTTLILDSITHEWNGQGGILEIVDAVSRSKYRGNSYAAWNEGTPRHQKFIDAMLASSCHIIATMRSKAVYVETEKNNGKKAIEKQGSAPQQRDGIEYEFTTVLDLNVDGHLANASKDRTGLFKDPFVISEDTGKALFDWLNKGIAPSNPPSNNPATNRVSKLSEASPIRKQFFSVMSSRHGGNPDKILDELSDFFDMRVNSSSELTDEQITIFMDALAQDRDGDSNDSKFE